jgi:TonB family protein
MLSYFLQVLIGVALAWLIYRLALRNKAAARYNRFFLLGGLVVPFVLPLIPLSASSVAAADPILLPEITISNPVALASDSQTPWLLYLYLGGVLSLFIYHLTGFFSFFNAMRNAQKTTVAKGVYALDKVNMPFSFLGRVFLPTGLSREERELIIAHEQFHIKRKHSLDVILGAIVHSVLWFFPLMPFYLRDLRQEHEFEVDQLMVTKTGFAQYAETLLAFNLKPIHHRLFHSFSSPNVKQRIIMMTKNQKQHAWKMLLFIPLLFSLIYLNACNKQESATKGEYSWYKMNEVDSPPQFVNCVGSENFDQQMECFQRGLVDIIAKNLQYPEIARNWGAEGTVYVSFRINENGEFINVQVSRKALISDRNEIGREISDALNYAAVSAFLNTPSLIPAQKDGRAVDVEYVVPISFKLPTSQNDIDNAN